MLFLGAAFVGRPAGSGCFVGVTETPRIAVPVAVPCPAGSMALQNKSEAAVAKPLCVDIDECDTRTHNCTAAQTCINTNPFFRYPLCPVPYVPIFPWPVPYIPVSPLPCALCTEISLACALYPSTPFGLCLMTRYFLGLCLISQYPLWLTSYLWISQ